MYYLWHAIFVAEKYKEEKIYNLKRYFNYGKENLF